MSSQTESPEPRSRGAGNDPSRESTVSPAVAYFAKVPAPGRVKTRLCPPLTHDEAAALYGAFLRQVVRPVGGCATFLYGWPEDELSQLIVQLPGLEGGDIEVRPQRGEDLWARMNQCYAELFEAGHRPVVIRNTDSPDLEEDLVQRAVAAVRPGRVALGPDPGGGFYLLALDRPRPELLRGLDEGADTVRAATERRIAELGLEVEILPERADVDTYDDLLKLWAARR